MMAMVLFLAFERALDFFDPTFQQPTLKRTVVSSLVPHVMERQP
jgi:hypothetical protein